MLKIFWAIFVVLSGGVATLLISLNSLQKIGLLILGVFFGYIVIMIVRDYHRQINCLLKDLESENDKY
jgi:hypothetical protein